MSIAVALVRGEGGIVRPRNISQFHYLNREASSLRASRSTAADLAAAGPQAYIAAF